MSTGTNAFWREVLDYIPGLVMLFRLDEEEQAHLIFVSDGVHDALGYEPEQYVLASEEQTIVKNDLERLIDKIAALTHPDNSEMDPVVQLTDRSGNSLPYSFDFKLFRPKSSKVNLISVALQPVDESGAVEISASKSTENTETSSEHKELFFAAESPAMKMLMRQVEDLSKLRQPILITGDVSTGKKTIAERLARLSAGLKSGTQVWVLDLTTVAAGTKRVFAGLDTSNENETLLDDIQHDLQLVIGDIGRLKAIDQRDLLMAIDTRSRRGFQTRIIATSTESLDELKRKNRLSSDFMYRMSFLAVFVPPLRDRLDDISLLAEHFASDLFQVIGQYDKKLESNQIKNLQKQSFDGGIEELKRAVVSVVFKLDKPKSSGVLPVSNSGAAIQFGAILPYEDMSKMYLEAVLEKTGGKIYGKGGAADLLDMKPTTLQSRLKKLGISR
jgi:DNA-binding NtrC family response regulator